MMTRSVYRRIVGPFLSTLFGVLLLSPTSAVPAAAEQHLPPLGQASALLLSPASESLARLSPPGASGRRGPLATSRQSADEDPFPALYIVFESLPDETIRPTMVRLVELAAPLVTISEGQLSVRLHESARDFQRLAIELVSENAGVIFRTTADVPRWLRGEFHSRTSSMPGSPIEGVLIPLDVRPFVVRLPVQAGHWPSGAQKGVWLEMRDRELGLIARFDMDRLIADTPQIQADPEAGILPTGLIGDPGNRVDLLVMGDGYTLGEQSKFLGDATTVLGDFFDISPYQAYENYINTYVLSSASAQSGADHPPYQAGCLTTSCCADPEMLSDPLQGTFVSTAFDARYCAFNIHRLLVVNNSKVYAAASAVPDWDTIMVIVNDTTYGGSGGTIGVISIHSFAVQIAQHEYGHSFADLADEYESPYPGFPPCSDLGGYAPCEANVTDVATRDLIKWNPWIDPSTPIPTEPEFDPAYAGVVGLFEGARYLSTGMYRPGQSCIMRTLGAPYCQVPSQAYVLKLYQGGWGIPASGIRLIEPGSTLPASDAITMAYPGTQLFSASVLQPSGGPPVSIEWQIDGVPVPGANTPSYSYAPSPSTLGDVEIRLLVYDTTPLVHPAMAGDSLQSSHTWTVTVEEHSRLFLPLISRGD